MVPRRWLVVGGAVAIAIVVLLIVKLTGDSAATTTRRTDESATADDGSAAPGPQRRSRLPVGEPAAASDTPVRETTIDGVRVRDHRKGDRPMPDLPISTHPPDRRRVAPQIVQDISAKLQAVMKECTAAIPADARGQEPRLEGVVFVDIKHGELTVTAATVQLRGVSNSDDADGAKACIEQKSVGQATAAKDAEDTTHYSITLSFAIPASP